MARLDENIVFDWAICELSKLRKGFILVRFDFSRNVIVWEDSNQWSHNFVRAMSKDAVRTMRESLLDFLEAGEKLVPVEQERISDSWRVSIGAEGNQEPILSISGTDTQSLAWRRLVRQIEEFCLCSFDL